MKMIVVFEKRERLKFIGHLDVMRAMQRALRRSGLPLRYSQGFNPHILLSFAAPLSVGVEGLREVMEVPLAEPVTEIDFLEALNAALPPLMRCLSARLVEDSQPAMMALCAAADYLISPLEDARALKDALPAFLAQPAIQAQRRSKKGLVAVDLRPLIHSAVATEEGIDVVLALQEKGTCKPELFLSSLADFAGVATPRCHITRRALLDQDLAPLEDA